MPILELRVNGSRYLLDDVSADTPLLQVLRERLGLVGSKFGCGEGYCGACTVHVDGAAVRACAVLAVNLAENEITTIEGLARDGRLHPLQQAWIDFGLPQCGYCQAGQIMSAAAVMARKPRPDDADIDAAMAGNICRCGVQVRIRQAIHQAGIGPTLEVSGEEQP